MLLRLLIWLTTNGQWSVFLFALGILYGILVGALLWR